jgi:membrane associated rhomboid family serine protease
VTGDFAFVPARLLTDPTMGVETIFTAMFMHASWSHIGGNMLFLWIFGDMAHVGGFVAGALLYRLFLAGRERFEDHPRWQRWAEPRRTR